MDESNIGQSWYADAGVLRQATAAYPSLQAAMFPPAPTSLTPAQSQDITVYELLQASPCVSRSGVCVGGVGRRAVGRRAVGRRAVGRQKRLPETVLFLMNAHLSLY